MVDLVDLLLQTKKDIVMKTSPQRVFYETARRNPHRYEIKLVGELKKKLELGKVDIPYVDKIVRYQPNEFYELMSEDFRMDYPEFKAPKSAAIIEQVSNVQFVKVPKTVEVSINRYLIELI